MKNNIYKIEEIKSRLAPVFGANGVKSALLFGSYANGSATGKSDIDLLVDSGLKGLDFVGLIEYIREALEKNVDVIDVRYVKKDSKVYNEARSKGVPIYG
ncbi:MAG: nucleotidyltransferase domain-containing protein [Chitinispirillia bacterium]|nr:nucleotidyltransferase domain-containing protein [Chitinispirillia bacterium]MCL2269477.1 nucleotidyltransferase domain-containing protein [Chitinispirillia bacterium]